MNYQLLHAGEYTFIYSIFIATYHSLIFVANAAKNPATLKLNSLAEHRASPPMTGIRDNFTRGPVTSPVQEKGIKLALFFY